MEGDRTEPRSLDDLGDEDLDRYILTRLAMAGVDLSVLPDDDPSAPADRLRILRSARAFLRDAIPSISALRLDPEAAPPEFYPAALYPLLSGVSDASAEE